MPEGIAALALATLALAIAIALGVFSPTQPTLSSAIASGLEASSARWTALARFYTARTVPGE